MLGDLGLLINLSLLLPWCSAGNRICVLLCWHGYVL